MPRPHCKRIVADLPQSVYFKPAGVPLRLIEEVVLTVDEFEAIRLADLEGMYQEKAAERMGVSRQTFGRIIESAHRKVADTFVNGKALRIEGGNIEVDAGVMPGRRGRRGWGREGMRMRHGRGWKF